MQKIQLLTQAVANQIAAGEVVNRPCSIVKEMMENAIDAGSSTVAVTFRDGGKEMIRITDDGCGMSPEDARMAFERHATSKINSVDDIYRLRTFGFRGEALASIAAVAEVELNTREANAELGTKVEISGGHFVSQNHVNCPTGSTFTIKNLFFNVPARRRFIDKSTTEARHITADFQRVALCNPSVAMQLTNNDSLLYSLPPAPLRGRIVGVIGKSIEKNLLEVSTRTTIVSVDGFVGSPMGAKQNNKEQFLFVNGRYFKSAYLHKAVLSAYEKLISASVQPSYFIYLTVDPERIDVNVHPQKTEVKFEDSQALWQIINASVREALAKLGVVPMMDFESGASFEIPVAGDAVSYRQPQIRTNPEFNPFADSRGRASRVSFSDFEAAFSAEIVPSEENYAPLIEYVEEDSQQQRMDIEEPAQGVEAMNILPVGERYFATNLDGALVVVDIKRAMETLMYDRFRAIVNGSGIASQQLLFPQVIPLSIDDLALVREKLDEIALCGLALAIPNDYSVEVMALPSELLNAPVAELLYDIIDALRDETLDSEQVRLDSLALVMSERAASASQRRYSQAELQSLMSELACSSSPNFTPRGKTIVTIIDTDEIKKRLK